MEQSDARVLDPCCGSRMMWFDRQTPMPCLATSATAARPVRRPHPSDRARCADGLHGPAVPRRHLQARCVRPPHLRHAGPKSWLRAKYGVLGDNWREDIRKGLQSASACWPTMACSSSSEAEDQVKIKEMLETDARPAPCSATQRAGRASLTGLSS